MKYLIITVAGTAVLIATLRKKPSNACIIPMNLNTLFLLNC